MTTGATGQLGLALPVQGELSGTWGDTVNNGITQYTNIAIAATLTLTNDGAVTLANTTGDASASNITSSLTGAGTVTAQFAIVRITGTLTTAKVITAPSYSKTYVVVNAATGGIVTFKASGQTGVSIAVGETAFVYFNGTDYVKVVGTATAGAAAGSNTQVQFNNSGLLGASASLTWDGTYLTAGSIKDSALTSGRVTYAGASGLLQDSTNLTFDGTTLTANALTVTNAVTLSGATANGVVYANGSKVLTSGSALTFDGTNLGIGTSSPSYLLNVGDSTAPTGVTTLNALFSTNTSGGSSITIRKSADTATGVVLSMIKSRGTAASPTAVSNGDALGAMACWAYGGSNYRETARVQGFVDTYTSDTNISGFLNFSVNIGGTGVTEQMRLTSTGLGIGTSSPTVKLQVVASSTALSLDRTDGNSALVEMKTSGTLRSYFGASSSSLFSWYDTSANEKMQLSTSGNLGLGVTPSAWGSTYRAAQIGLSSSLVGITNDVQTHLTTNARFDGTNWVYIATSPASRYMQDNNVHKWFNAASGTAGNAISFTQAMTLTAAGDLGLGTTSPATYGSRTNLYVAGTLGGALILGETGKTFQAVVLGDYNNGQMDVGTATNHPMRFITNNTERARIDSSGNLLVGTTSQILAGTLTVQSVNTSSNGITAYCTNGAGSYTAFSGVRNSNAGHVAEWWYNTSTQVGNINITSSATAYNTSSDYRLKNTIAPITGALAKVQALKPVTYKWNLDGSNGEGFIAHELAEVCPHAVTGEKDAVDEDGNPKYQGIDTSFLVATLTAAIQELKAEFDAYKASHP